MGGDGGLWLGEDGVGMGLIGRGVDRRRCGSGPVTLRPAEATLTMSFRPELRDGDESE